MRRIAKVNNLLSLKKIELYLRIFLKLDEIELRTSKDNENENSEARDNVRFDKMIL